MFSEPRKTGANIKSNICCVFWAFCQMRSVVEIEQVLEMLSLTLSSLHLPLSSSSTTSRELLSQFSTCSEWKWLEVGEKFKKMTMY